MAEGGYYGIAGNFNKLCYFAYLMEYSYLKTLASKYKCQMSEIIDKFRDNTAKNKGKWCIAYETKGGKKRCYFARYTDCKDSKNMADAVSNAAVLYGYSRNTLESRLKEKCCELCGTTESDHYEIHHVNKVKNLKGKEAWEFVSLPIEVIQEIAALQSV